MGTPWLRNRLHLGVKHPIVTTEEGGITKKFKAPKH